MYERMDGLEYNLNPLGVKPLSGKMVFRLRKF